MKTVKPVSNEEESAGNGAPVDGGGGPPYDGHMEKRLTILKTRLDAILPTLATKADVDALRVELHKSLDDVYKAISDIHKAISDLHKSVSDVHKAVSDTYKWIVGTMIGLFIGLGGLFVAIKPEPSVVQIVPQAIPAQPGTQLPSAPQRSESTRVTR